MSTQTAHTNVEIVWDDSVVIVFSFADSSNNTFNCGFVHIAVAMQTGSTTQITPTVQAASSIQATPDAQTWIETLKNSHRNKTAIDITFDDSTSVPFTTSTAKSFQLQTLFSLAG